MDIGVGHWIIHRLLFVAGQSEGCANGTTKYIVVPGKRQGKETEKKPVETPKTLKTKKGGFKKQRNKNKFIKKNDQAVNVEKDETGVPGDAHHSDVPIQPAVTTEDPLTDTVMMQPGEEAWPFEHEPTDDTVMVQPDEEAWPFKHEPTGDTAMLQPDGEATKVEQDRLRGTAMLQPDDEGRRVEQEPLSNTPMVLHNEEARSVKQEPLIGTAMPQPHVEDRRVGAEPPRDAAMVQPNDEARCVKQELLIDTAMPLPNEEAGAAANPVPLSDSTTARPNAVTTNINEESVRNAALAQHNEEARTVNQEPPSSASLLQPKEPRVENGEFVSENKNQGDASREANRSIEDMPEKCSDNSSAFTSAE